MRSYVRHIAGLLGRTTDTVRRYESKGVIPRAERDPVSGHRYWLDGDLDAMKKKFGLQDAAQTREESKLR